MSLIIAEDFYSIQGEGANNGCPAVFLRLAGCNLRCNGFSYVDPQTKIHLGCDTKHVWTKGKKLNNLEIISNWQTRGWLDKLKSQAHLVITGGEPLLQQDQLLLFIKLLDNTLIDQHNLNIKIFIELETNGTQMPKPDLLARIDQFNVSPKLSNSHETKTKAYQPEVISTLAEYTKTKFKFVLKNPSDINEVINNYVIPFQIPKQQIWLMPEGGRRADIADKSKWLVEICKEYTMNYSPRLHLEIWDEAVGV